MVASSYTHIYAQSTTQRHAAGLVSSLPAALCLWLHIGTHRQCRDIARTTCNGFWLWYGLLAQAVTAHVCATAQASLQDAAHSQHLQPGCSQDMRLANAVSMQNRSVMCLQKHLYDLKHIAVPCLTLRMRVQESCRTILAAGIA